MATTEEILGKFSHASAVADGDQFLLQAAGGTDGSGVGNRGVKVTAEVVRAYLMSRFGADGIEGMNAAITELQETMAEVYSLVTGNTNSIGVLRDSVSTVSTRVTALEDSVSAVNGGVVSQVSASVSIVPNTLNVWGAVDSLAVALADGADGVVNEYMMQFTVSGDSFTLALPSGVRWLEEPEWTDGSTYQVSVMNGLAIAAEWEGVNS